MASETRNIVHKFLLHFFVVINYMEESSLDILLNVSFLYVCDWRVGQTVLEWHEGE